MSSEVTQEVSTVPLHRASAVKCAFSTVMGTRKEKILLDIKY